MKNILIIGGSYFAGRVCVETLARDPENRLFVLNRGNRPLAMPGVAEIVCNRHDTRLKDAVPKVQWHAVIDFCAYTPLDVIQLMLAIPRAAIGQYIFISTASVYADTLALPVCEDAPGIDAPQPELGAAADYGYDKYRAEEKVAALCGKSNIPYTILRPAIIYGKYNYAPRESWFFDLMTAGKAIALPKNELALFQFVSVWDAARAVSLCMGNPAAYDEVFNLAAEDLVSYRRFVRVIETVTAIKATIYLLDSKDIDARQIPLPFPLEKHLIYSGEKIVKTLSFSYTPFAEGMRDTWRWYAAQKGENRHGR